MQVDLIDLMERPDRVFRPTCDEKCAGLSNQEGPQPKEKSGTGQISFASNDKLYLKYSYIFCPC